MIKREQIRLKEYIDLTDANEDLSKFKITPSSPFNCEITKEDEPDLNYKGFILAKSKGGKAYTLCDVSFQYSDTDSKYAVRLTFRRTTEKMLDKIVGRGAEFQRISFNTGQDGYREFWKMIGFLEKFREYIDIGNFVQDFQIVNSETVTNYMLTIDGAERIQYLANIIEGSKMDKADVENLLILKERKRGIQVFELLMKNENNYVEKYKTRHGLKKTGEEIAWQHFFKKHRWIFGLGLDYRITSEYLSEQYIGSPDSTNKGNPAVDYLGIDEFTTLVEIKTPRKRFLTEAKAPSGRANTWTIHRDFIDACAQCLGQKDAITKNINNKALSDDAGKIIDQRVLRTVDPKVMLVYGNKAEELPAEDATVDNIIKRETLERQIRDSRNITVVSFDELLRRAKAIVENL